VRNLAAAMTRISLAGAALVIVGGAACKSQSPTAATPRQLQVGGTYQITKTGLEDTCGGPLTPFVSNGTVTHTAGSGTIILNDGFTDYIGNVSTDGALTVPARNTAPHLGAPVVTSFQSGRFTTDGFTADVRLDIDGPHGTPPLGVCFVRQSWRGIKQGAPNIIP